MHTKQKLKSLVSASCDPAFKLLKNNEDFIASSTNMITYKGEPANHSDYVSALLLPIEYEDTKRVKDALHSSGTTNEILSTRDTDSVAHMSFKTPGPRVWLNDEIIYFYMLAIAKRF